MSSCLASPPAGGRPTARVSRFGEKKLLALAFIGSFGLTAAPQAARAQSAVTLPVITVHPSGANQSLTVPSVAQQRRQLDQTAGSVGFIDAKTYKNTYANNLRDVLNNAPGVYVQDRYSQELRLSIRGAGITRAYHTRGLEILQDGIPTNLADGSGDYYQIDPLGLRSVEIYKGGNALSFGSSTLGGAINFVQWSNGFDGHDCLLVIPA